VVSASGSWDSTEFTPLAQATVQAQGVADVLRTEGFEVKELSGPDATSQKIEAYIQQLASRVTEDDRFLFYFSGHGVTEPGPLGDVGYLLTYPATRRTLLTDGLPMVRMQSEYANLRAKHILFVLDACFSGLAIQRSNTPGQTDLQKFLQYEQIAAYTSKPTRAILAAGAKGEPALDINGGIFTKAFISGLQGEADYSKNGVITVEELFVYIQKRVLEESALHAYRQTPQLGELRAFGEGQFVFLK
jgi:uncharacterized caspase-like protein